MKSEFIQALGAAYFCKIIVGPDVSMHGMYYVCFVYELWISLESL